MFRLGRAKKPAVVVFSDLHVGSVVGLWPGKHPIEGGGEYEVNVFQKWLHACWHEAMKEIAQLRPKPVVVLNGDMLQGTNPRDGQLVTTKVDIQVWAATTLLEPARETAEKMYVIRGTEWHEGKAAEFLEFLAAGLDVEKDPASGQYTWWELFFDLDGHIMHFAHHIGTSSVPWYEATVPLRDLLLFIAEIVRFGGPDVRITVRSHRHRYVHVDAPPDLHAIVTPAWQLRTAFSYKRSSAMLPQIGYVLLEADGDDVLVRKRLFKLPEMKVEVA